MVDKSDRGAATMNKEVEIVKNWDNSGVSIFEDNRGTYRVMIRSASEDGGLSNTSLEAAPIVFIIGFFMMCFLLIWICIR